MASPETDYEEPVTPFGHLFLQPCLTQVIHCAMGLQNPIDVNSFKQALKTSIMIKHPRFSSLMVLDRHGSYHWSKTLVDIDKHVLVISHPVAADCGDDEDAVNEYLADLAVSKPIRDDKPLWEVHLLMAHNCAVFRVHHAIADGASLMSMFSECFKKPDCIEMVHSSTDMIKDNKKKESNIGVLAKIWDWLKMVLFTVVYAVALSLRIFVSDEKTVISGGEGVELWPRKLTTARFLMEDMKIVKAAIPNSTINDVLCGVISCGLFRYLNYREPKSFPRRLKITGVVAVNLRKRPGLLDRSELMNKDSQVGIGNKTAIFQLPLCYSKDMIKCPLQHMKRIKVILDRKKKSLEAIFCYKMGYLFQLCLGPKVAAKILYKYACNASFAISNMVGPSNEMAITGNNITYLRVNAYAMPTALIMHMVSYGERADMQILVARDIIPDPEVLAKYFEEALLNMKGATLSMAKQNCSNIV